MFCRGVYHNGDKSDWLREVWIQLRPISRFRGQANKRRAQDIYCQLVTLLSRNTYLCLRHISTHINQFYGVSCDICLCNQCFTINHLIAHVLNPLQVIVWIQIAFLESRCSHYRRDKLKADRSGQSMILTIYQQCTGLLFGRSWQSYIKTIRSRRSVSR